MPPKAEFLLLRVVDDGYWSSRRAKLNLSIIKQNKDKDSSSDFLLLEQFSIECWKAKTKVITLTKHKEQRQSNEPIKTRSNYM